MPHYPPAHHAGQGKHRDRLRHYGSYRREGWSGSASDVIAGTLGYREPSALRSRRHMPRGPGQEQRRPRSSGARRLMKHRADGHSAPWLQTRRRLRAFRRAPEGRHRRCHLTENRMTLHWTLRPLAPSTARWILQRSRRHRLAPRPRKHDMQSWEVGGGRAPRQPGQVRKEAAAVSFRSGRFAGLPPVETQPPGGRCGG